MLDINFQFHKGWSSNKRYLNGSRSIQEDIATVRLISIPEITLYALNIAILKLEGACLTGTSYDSFYIIYPPVNLLHLNFKTVTFSRTYQRHYISECVANIPLLLRKVMT